MNPAQMYAGVYPSQHQLTTMEELITAKTPSSWLAQ